MRIRRVRAAMKLASASLAEPDAVEAPRLGRLGQAECLLECREVALAGTSLLEEDAEVHGGPTMPHSGAAVKAVW